MDEQIKASNHNMILVDGQGYETENINNIWINNKIDEVEEVKDFCSEGDLTYICGETAPLYKKSLNMKRIRIHNIALWIGTAIASVGALLNDKSIIESVYNGEFRIKNQIR